MFKIQTITNVKSICQCQNLKIRADWATLDWITLVICYFREGVKIKDEEIFRDDNKNAANDCKM